MALTLQDSFEVLGLSKRESAVYFSLCIFGPLSITKIGQRSALPRTTVDAIVRRLSKRSLIEAHTFGKRQRWGLPKDFGVVESKIIEALVEIRNVAKRQFPIDGEGG